MTLQISGMILILICMIVIWFFTGMKVGENRQKTKINSETKAILRVDRSDPNERPYFFLEVYKEPELLTDKEYIMVQVCMKDYISRK